MTGGCNVKERTVGKDAEMKSLILVVSRQALFGSDEGPHGYGTEKLEDYYSAICGSATFMPRGDAERCFQYKQIIPYMLVTCGSKLFMLRRFKSQTEERLHDKVSIGVGGHIDLGPDTNGTTAIPDIIENGLRRELAEELEVNTEFTFRPIGYLNDDTNDVGQVHFGLVYHVECKSDDVRVRETEMMKGGFATKEEIEAAAKKMETWSQLLVPHVGSVIG
ncbi:MAG: hypothetical protein ACYS8W_01425 [Planctomycetota bacterium]|jgi:predicted NUDIX family phosphoesterase